MIKKNKFPRLPLLFFVLFLCSCGAETQHKDTKKWSAEKITSPELKVQVDYLNRKIHAVYPINSDSAIIYSRQLIALYNAEKMPYNEYEEYLKLSELYNSRKHDDASALNCYAEALKIMLENNGTDIDHPYFFIDMGNMLYNNKLYPEAVENYEKSIKISSIQKDSFAISVGLNNIALCHKEQSSFDSALYFFREALRYRTYMQPQLKAQSYMYIASVFASKQEFDSMLFYKKYALNNYHLQVSSNSSLTSKTILRDVKINDANLMANYYDHQKQYSKAILQFEELLILSEEANEWNLYVKASYYLSELYSITGQHDMVLKYATIAYSISAKNKYFDYCVKSAKLLSQTFAYKGDKAKESYYLKQTILYADSLEMVENSTSNNSNKLLLINAHIKQSVKQYKDEASKANFLIANFKILIAVLLFIILCIVLFYRILSNRQKKNHLNQLNEISSQFEKSNTKIYNNNPDLNLSIENNLKYLMDTEKVFVRKSLSLTELSELMKTNTSYLSNYFNKKLNTNFNDYLNAIRIKYACELFEEDKLQKKSLEQIADEVGFSSKRTFYSAFKKFTGLTPASFRNNIR
jgi:AraC-like DNA-binding protein/tetratricopeptide (TPR) repeat protein